MDKFLAIIPARGGSKRLKNKNILKLHDKPLIAWSIIEAKKSKYIDEIIVTSEDKNILKTARKFKAKTIKRKKEYANDTSPTYLALFEVIKKLKRVGKKYKNIILLQPTSPLRSSADIDEAIKLFLKNKKSVISVNKTKIPNLSFKANSNLFLGNISKNKSLFKRSQDFDEFVKVNGSIYIADTKYFLKYKTFFLKFGCFGYLMDDIKSIDIDNLFDFKVCEMIIKDRL